VTERPLLLFLVTEDWYFLSHRLPLAIAAAEAGFRVAVATRVGQDGDAIRQAGFELYPLNWRRSDTSPLKLLGDIWKIGALLRWLRPALVHCIAIKPAVLGGLAAWGAGVPALVTTLAGRGLTLSGSGMASRLAGVAVRTLLRFCMAGRAGALIVQNADDGAWAGEFPAVPDVTLVRGSGVDVSRFSPIPEPVSDEFVVAQASRMLRIKGVTDLVAAVTRLRTEGVKVRLLLAGDSDPGSHAAIAPEQLAEWNEQDGICWLGHLTDVRTLWSEAHLAVQASWGGEGVPKALLEAAGCGRALLGTDVPGIREIVQPGRNGLLVSPGDPAALAEGIRQLAADPTLRQQMAAESRRIVTGEFAVESVIRQTLDLYRAVLRRAGTAFEI
jgi:glycosyltransferase involved in cell wall biosynthesis